MDRRSGREANPGTAPRLPQAVWLIQSKLPRSGIGPARTGRLERELGGDQEAIEDEVHAVLVVVNRATLRAASVGFVFMLVFCLFVLFCQ